jgi:type II secretory pathway component GspD/PulD (secretin)
MTVLIVVVIVAGLVGLLVWLGPIEININQKGPEVTKAPEPNKPAAEPDEPEKAKEPNEPNKPTEPNEPNEPAKPAEPNEPNKPADPNEPNKPAEPNDPMESLSLKEVEVKNLLSKIREWTGKPIIPVGDALKQKITIYSGEKIPRSQALRLIFRALREQGYVPVEEDGLLLLRPMAGAKIRKVPTIPDSVPLASLENREQIVQKFFKLKNYSPSLLQQVIQPMMPEYGYVYTVESTNHLVAIDTVSNLFRVQDIIEQLDVPEAEQTVTKTFILQDGDPVEIVQLLNILLSGGSISGPSSSSNKDRDRSRRDRDRDRERRRRSSSNDSGSGSNASVVISAAEGPVTLIPMTKRKWIIAKASAESIEQIGKWIEKLDEKKPDEREYSLRPVIHAEVDELADYINDTLQRMPLKANVMVQALTKERKIMIVGSAENREMVEQMIADIDIPSEKFKTEDILLRYADPEEVKKNIDDLYGESYNYSYSSRWGSSRYTRSQTRGPDDPDMVKVYAFPILKQVTVMCSEENMKLIKEQIKNWDRPINIDDVLPYIIEVKNSDPVKMADLLTRLFTETTQERNPWDYFFGRSSAASKTIVGPLYGQMSFEAVPDTKKIIVQSKIPEGFQVAKKLVEMLDTREMAEVPRVVTLNYADPEDLSERLNAIFSEPGTVAPIRLRKARLSKEGMESAETTGEDQPNQGSETTDTYTPPWSRGQRNPLEMPLSNVIGKIRFIPDWRSKSILVLAPEEFMEQIVEMIKDLDRYVNQLRIKAIVLEVSKKDMTSLGIQLKRT